MATCGHCTKTNVTVAHVRNCGQAGSAVATTELPAVVTGSVVTVDGAQGYWQVNSAGTMAFSATQVRGDAKGHETSFAIRQVEMVFPNLNAAAEYDLAIRTEATLRRNREILHGDPDYCRGCAKGWAGAKWHRDGCPVIATRNEQVSALEAPSTPDTDVWSPVNTLREQVTAHLHYQAAGKLWGRFAVSIDGTLKFLTIKKVLNGRYAGRVFVYSMGSDTAYPVKAPATLTTYLTAVLRDPVAAAKRYADELGQCSDCGRPLTNEESRARGIGPDCWAKRG